MYALIEGTSRGLEIRRQEIEGVLYATRNRNGDPIQSIVLVDAVPGGAGHVRRLARKPELIRALRAARSVLRDCDACRLDESCYNCLQDYSNQHVHHLLRRREALEYLESIKLGQRPLACSRGTLLPHKAPSGHAPASCRDSSLDH